MNTEVSISTSVCLTCDGAKREANLVLPTIVSVSFQIDLNLSHVSKKYNWMIAHEDKMTLDLSSKLWVFVMQLIFLLF